MRKMVLLSAVVGAGLLTGCGTGTPSPSATTTVIKPAARAVPSPALTGTLAGKCVTGIEDVTAQTFAPLTSLSSFSTGPNDRFALAFQLTLTDTSSVTVQVNRFSVVFYSSGQESGSYSVPLFQPQFITAGQSLTWTEDPWGEYQSGQAALGPWAAGVSGAVDVTATCQLVQWN